MPKKKRRLMATLLFIVYFAVLFYFLFFSEKMGRTYSEREYHYNLVPLKEIGRFLTYWESLGMRAVLLNIVGNVAAFVPFGIFLPVFSARCRKIRMTVYYSFELSLLVELLQLITRVGSFDVDDLILNTLGGMIGFLLYLLGRYMFRGDEHEKSS
ncbi:MAG: VanZ family protein [Clostridiales bacterium]|nr:VanZ family protein [Roseburia sp.]MDD7636928.1 VanZ family protein [Clostridiales bacterium]MDY4113475.1 VanZ family protein [Roseburia sp.]